MVQRRGQQVGDHNTPQKGGSTLSKQTECGFATGDVGAPIFTQNKENMTIKDIRTSGHNKGPLQLASGTQESVRSCQVPVVSGQSVLTTDKSVDKQVHCDSKITAPVVSQKQQAPHDQQGMGRRLTCVDSGSRATLIQDDEYDGRTPYQGGPDGQSHIL